MPRQPAIGAVVFDLDDTLYLERDYVRGGYRAAAAELRRLLGRDEPFEQWLWRRFCEGQSGGAFDALSDAFGLHLAAEQIAMLVAAYRLHRPDIAPLPGARETLERLAVRGVRLGLLSDGFLPAQKLKLEALGLTAAFEAVVWTEEMGRECWKPSPAGYERVARQLGAAHGGCVYVGDNPAKDFEAPNALCWRTVRLRCRGQLHYEVVAQQPAAAAQVVIAAPADLETALFGPPGQPPRGPASRAGR